MSPHAKPGTVFVDHSTIAPTVAVEIAEYLKSRQQSLVDAPVTGGSMGAQKGLLTIFCGGSEADVEKVKPFLAAYAKRCERVGPSGSGQMMKLVNQIAVGGALLALCEALSFAAKGGLDVAQARDLVGSGAAGSWAFDNYGPKILAKDWRPGFSIVNQRKDFAYTIEAAEALRAAVPGTKLVDQLLSELENQGRGQDTTAALFELMLKLEQ